ncbi:MAG: hypothetical protein JOZ58_03105 [Acetobacteraceae bacterium]|nr:hypothetical protein [Acetobacteraceae bacterium]
MDVAGEYNVGSTIVELDFSIDDCAAASRFSKSLPRYDMWGFFIKPSLPTFDLSLDRFRPALTFEHEHEHYRTVMSSSFGLLLWRIKRALTIDFHYLIRSRESAPITRVAILHSAQRFAQRLGELAGHADHQHFDAWDILALGRQEDYRAFVC